MQKKTSLVRDIIVVGFALFSMFFGAGNVIFPPFLGLESGSQWVSGFAAYFIADIGLAMLAMFALLRVGSSEAVVSRVGQIPAAVLMSAIILCVGPMVAIPRTSATTYEMAIVPNLSGVSPVVFSILFFALILALCIRESAVVDIVGKILTPLLLLGLFAIIIKGVITPLGEPSALPQIANVAVTGIKAGYQTMDALAALPFGIIVLQSVTAKGYDSGRKQFRVVGGSAVLAGILLLAVYMLLPAMRPYYLVLLASLPFVLWFNGFKQFTDGITDTRISMWILLGGNVLNIIGNYLLIYGKAGFPELGLLGAGIATLASRILMVIAYVILFFCTSRYDVFRKGFAMSHSSSPAGAAAFTARASTNSVRSKTERTMTCPHWGRR